MLLDGVLKLATLRSGACVVVVPPPVGVLGAPAPIVVDGAVVANASPLAFVPPPDEHPASARSAAMPATTALTSSLASRRRRTCAGRCGGSGSPRSPR